MATYFNMPLTDVSQHYLREKRSLLSLFLQTICHKSLHGLWAITAHFAQVRGKVTSANHKDNLIGEICSLHFPKFRY